MIASVCCLLGVCEVPEPLRGDTTSPFVSGPQLRQFAACVYPYRSNTVATASFHLSLLLSYFEEDRRYQTSASKIFQPVRRSRKGQNVFDARARLVTVGIHCCCYMYVTHVTEHITCARRAIPLSLSHASGNHLFYFLYRRG